MTLLQEGPAEVARDWEKPPQVVLSLPLASLASEEDAGSRSLTVTPAPQHQSPIDLSPCLTPATAPTG